MYHLNIKQLIVGKVFILIFILLLVSCEKENPLDNITPEPGWAVEILNEDYYIQFPISYSGVGFENNSFNKINPSKDIIINQYRCNYFVTFDCVGDSLVTPLPDKITRLPSPISSSFHTFNNKEYIIDKDSLISGIIYYSDGFKVEDENMYIINATYYKRLDANYISMLQLDYNAEKVDTVRMICNSIVGR